ncbi:rod shape-determining protein MreD [Abyssalbus ytuae]|uniref:Rod shape-determining protein MreD n=1 Tax=Abyssalbus ytuae TaxID=2926907 RepID=A0A9E7A2Q1_9FLAO|nr:rod shape-determining protein MreD [Abyssalbus ytuae]UOB18711.1 rod shape-determining protein MreD [Abyssalbus ytuae]
MNNFTIRYIFLFIALVILQASVFNNINFMGYINPYIYVIFIAYFPIKKDKRPLFIFLSFLVGLSIDFFSDSGGINAAASLTTAYIRPLFLRSTFGNAYDYQTLKISNTTFPQQTVYLTLLILTHHLILFSLEIFSFTHILLIIKKTLFSGIFSILLSLMLVSLFSNNKTE